ncbi:Protein RTF2-like protein [Smittium culicis]|uniref:Protein RTF2-like protein n=1 Tax=Smittium culicis TaxID=133412 RepID=A0A1R1XQC8_9FUNG|nr:Protein RTF2-like protein [Smittium culicis]OMJ16857.1 Protein RTF2-like protein [Smittium culicis]
MNGRVGFCCMWDCGCVISEEAASLMKTDLCLNCGKKIDRTKVVTLNPSAERAAEMLDILSAETRAKKSKSSSKSNKLNSAELESSYSDKKIAGMSAPAPASKKRRMEPAASDAKAAKLSSCSIPSSRIIEQYSSATASEKGQAKSNPVLDSIFINDNDRKKNDDNKNYLFKGTFNRYVS